MTDAGLKCLKGFTQLGWLYLANTKVTDAGLQHLKGLMDLQDLSLVATEVTDSGLGTSKGWPNSENWTSATRKSQTTA